MLVRKIVTAAACLLLILALVAVSLNPVAKTGIPAATQDPEGNLTVTTIETGPKLSITFSEEGHFVASKLALTLTASRADAEIYYTLNGSVPTKESALYKKEITLIPIRNTACYVVRAVAFLGEVQSEVYTRTYFANEDIDERFDTLVVSLSTDGYNLYDHDYGIFVPGRLRQEYIEEYGSADLNPTKPANYNLRGMEGERPVYAEFFTADGTRVVAQNAGMRVHGGWSRDAAQKSIKLIARKSYEPEKGKFTYDFFPEDAADDLYGTPISSYDTIVLRNGANDRNFGMIRNEVAAKLAADWGFVGVSPTRPVAVFLNGEYYGFAMMQVALEEHYLTDMLNAPIESFDILGNGEEWYDTSDEADELVALDLMALRELADLDLTKDVNYAKVTSVLDVDNMLMYYAFQIYMGNDDWPNNNLKRWRYTGAVQDDSLHPWLDGRWRYLMYDLDWTLGLYSGEPTQPTFQNVLGGSKNVYLLVALLKRPELAERFTNLICDLVSYLSPARIEAVVDEVYGASENEIAYALRRGMYDSWVSQYSVADNHRYMSYYAEQRSKYMYRNLERYFGYAGDMYYVETNDHVRINSQNTGGGWYYTELSVTLTAEPPKGMLFDYWLVNGERRNEEILILSDADAPYGTVDVELVLKEAPVSILFVSAEYSPEWNGCILRNESEEAVNLLGLYISDDPNFLKRWAFSDIRLEAGKTITLSGSQYSDKTALHTVPLSFNAQVGEVLILSDEEGNVLDFLRVSWRRMAD